MTGVDERRLDIAQHCGEGAVDMFAGLVANGQDRHRRALLALPTLDDRSVLERVQVLSEHLLEVALVETCREGLLVESWFVLSADDLWATACDRRT